MRRFLIELWERNRILTATGWIVLAAGAVIAVIAPFDSRTVGGVNPWFAPIKLCISVAIYVWTVAWFVGYLTRPRWALVLISWGIPLLMIGGLYFTISQAARGVPLPFNESTPYDAMVFSLTGGMNSLNVILAGLLLGLFFQRGIRAPSAILWGIRLGLAFFILGSLEGLVMVSHAAHTVGAPDGGPGLPFVNWSTVAGDLRVAHFMGIHSLQLIPLFGALVSWRLGKRSVAIQLFLVITFVLFYAALTYLMFAMALAGRPLSSIFHSG